jgi:DNA polymerase delta subunit 1
VTYFGREMLQLTKKVVEQTYPGAKVIYGDTDSVMVKFPMPPPEGPRSAGGIPTAHLQHAMQLGAEAAQVVTKHFPAPIKLEFEKVYGPFLLLVKKHYAGLFWTRADKYDKLDVKGIETVRRDICQLTRDLLNQILEDLLLQGSVEQAKTHVRETVAELMSDRCDISQLIISKGFSKEGAEDYKTKQPHIELAKRMQLRDAATAPRPGERIPYVVVTGPMGAKMCECAEDPMYALQNRIPLNLKYYLTNMLEPPVRRLLDSVLPKSAIDALFAHQHAPSTPLQPNRGLGKYFVRKPRCSVCHTDQATKGVCGDCRDTDAHRKRYLEQQEDVRRLDQEDAAMTSACWRCQGPGCTVPCANRDCPIFFRRQKVKLDGREATKVLAELL